MERSDFLKTLGLGALAVSVTPTIIKAEEVAPAAKNACVAIDLESISNFSAGGRRITPMEILNLYQRTGVLLYKPTRYSKAPIVLQGEIKAVDITKNNI